jgi:hypothetical protein
MNIIANGKEHKLDVSFDTYDAIERRINKSIASLLTGFQTTKRSDMITVLTEGVKSNREKMELLGDLQKTSPVKVQHAFLEFLKALMYCGMSEEEIAEQDRKNVEALQREGINIKDLMGG